MTPFQKWLLLGSSAATALTGVVYAWMKYFMEPVEPWAVINHPWQPWVLKAHILVAPVLVFAFGIIAVDHVWKHYRCRVPMGRRSGIAAGLFFFPMVGSGYLIQAVTHAGWLQALVWAHLATSAVYVVGLVAHQRLFRKRGREVRDRRRDSGIQIDDSPEGRPRVTLVLPEDPEEDAARRGRASRSGSASREPSVR